MAHPHDSCIPDLARDLAVTGAVELRAGHGAAGTPAPPRSVSPVVETTPPGLHADVVARSSQVPVVVLLGSPVDPGMSALRRELTGAASSAALRWILAVADVDRFPRLATVFRPVSLPVVTVVADGTGVAAWTPQDATGDRGVDCLDWVETVVARVAPRLTGLPEDAMVADRDTGPTGPTIGPAADPRLRQAASLVGEGDPEGAVALYDVLLSEYPDPASQRMLRRARAAVRVLVRTKDLDQRTVYTVLAAGTPGDLLRTADVLVLDDRPVEAVGLLVAALSGSAAGRPAAEREQLRARVLDFVLLLEPGTPAAEQARRSLASALF